MYQPTEIDEQPRQVTLIARSGNSGVSELIVKFGAIEITIQLDDVARREIIAGLLTGRQDVPVIRHEVASMRQITVSKPYALKQFMRGSDFVLNGETVNAPLVGK